jgi:transketolase
VRNTYLKALYELAQRNKDVVSLIADNGMIVYDDFRRDFPDRYFNFGISECNMMAAAAGMASVGKIPFVYTINAFLAYRAYEFLRDDVCLQNQNVKIVGIGSGITYSTLGPSHHTTEDIGLLRGLPNLTVFSPATRTEVKWMMNEAYMINGPVYIRLGNNSEDYYADSRKFKLGEPTIVKDGKGIVIFTTGSIIDEVIKASTLLGKQGIDAKVVSVHTLKPLNAQTISDIVDGMDCFVTVEEHNVVGGLYTIISEALVDQGISKKGLKIGLNDVFATDYGKIGDVRKANGLDSHSIFEKILAYIN